MGSSAVQEVSAANDAVGPEFFEPALPIAQLQPSRVPANPRKRFDPDRLRDLAASIATRGIIEPLVVRRVEDHYEIICGERRFRAALQAGLAHVPAMVRCLTDTAALEVMVVENKQREDVDALEEADGFRRLLDTGYGIDTLAAQIGLSKKYVYDRMKLLSLIPAAQDLLSEGTITAGHAILLARLQPADQVRAIDPDDGGLFIYDLQDDDPVPGDDQAPPPKIAVSVREFDAWIERHVRLDLSRPMASDEFPAVARAQEMASRVVSITLQPFLDARQEDGAAAAGDRILTSGEWKRADEVTCEHSLLGVVVIGRDKGATFPVCVTRGCKVHWRQERAVAGRAPTNNDEPGVDEYDDQDSAALRRQRDLERDRERQQWQAKQDREAAERAAYRTAAPDILAAFIASVKKVKAGVLADAVVTGAALHPKALAAFPKAKTAEDVLQVIAVSMVAEGLFNEWSAPQQVPLWAKRFGIDLKPLLKPAKTAVHASAQKKSAAKKKTGKGRR